MKIIFYLSTCSTCSRILKELNPDKDFILQDIKHNPITEQQLRELAEISGSYESLFSRKAIKYKAMGLAEKKLGECDYKKHILEEYTFLKRPVIRIDNQVFIGNSRHVIAAVNALIN